jgi:uncharacterized protein (DUF1786 family)
MKDTLAELVQAVHRLQNVIKSIGPDIELTAIQIGGGKYAGFALDRAMQASASYLQCDAYPDARNNPEIRRVMGVEILMRESK